MIISIDVEKAFDKIQHPFMIINSPERKHRRNIPQHNKSHIQQTHSNIFNGEKLKAFPLRSKTRQGCPFSLLLFNIVLEVQTTETREEKKSNPDWKRSKTLFADDMILYIENPKLPSENY